MLKIGQNWSKIAHYPPNAQQRSAPLIMWRRYEGSRVVVIRYCTVS